MKHAKREQLQVDDIRQALRIRNMDLVGTSETRFSILGKQGMRNPKIWSLLECTTGTSSKEIELVELLENPALTQKRAPELSLHWLALEGIQPIIPKNPPPHLMNCIGFSKLKNNPLVDRPKPLPSQTYHILSKELRLYFEKVVSTVKEGNEGLLEAGKFPCLFHYFQPWKVFEETLVYISYFLISLNLLLNRYLHVDQCSQ